MKRSTDNQIQSWFLWWNGKTVCACQAIPFTFPAQRRYETDEGRALVGWLSFGFEILNHQHIATCFCSHGEMKREAKKETKKRVHSCFLKAWYQATPSLSSEVNPGKELGGGGGGSVVGAVLIASPHLQFPLCFLHTAGDIISVSLSGCVLPCLPCQYEQ